ncbi:MAG: response regulator transcription factor [Planctomycetaceae bacterium]|nr:response regulator transcription factor [Planctomycetaceae bacterium]
MQSTSHFQASATATLSAATSPAGNFPAAGSAPTAEAVVADINRVNAESIAWCLKAYGGFRNVSAVETPAELLACIRSQRPQVVLIGERMLLRSMRELFSEMAIRLGETRVAAFVDSLTDRQLDLVVNNRVTGLLSRTDNVRTISEQLIQVSAGQSVLSPKLTDRLRIDHHGQFISAANSRMQKLNDRQWDVLLRIASGARVADVAEALHITEKAVEAHKYRIMRIIGAHDRVDLCRWAIREGLIEA